MKGLVIQSTGSFYKVKDENNILHICKLKGKFRLENSMLTNPIAVGDRVNFSFGKNKSETALIDKIYKRKNFICRESNHKKDYTQIIGSNLDLAVLVSVPYIDNSALLYIDRFLVSSEFFNIQSLIVFNKIDLLKKKEQYLLDKVIDNYNSIGYKALCISALCDIKFQCFINAINKKIVLLSGNSGVGKSTITNKLIKTNSQKVGDLSIFNKGRHVTSSSSMFQVNEHTYVIDTPGVQYIYPKKKNNTYSANSADKKKNNNYHKLFDGIEKSKLYTFFPDIVNYANCKFDNCLHIHEPGCGVRAALNKKNIIQSRYNNYIKLINEF